MHLLLITPESSIIRNSRRGQLNNFQQLTMPYLAGFVPPEYRVELVDESRGRVDLNSPADLVAITCNTPNAPHVYRLSEAFRRRGKTVVLGGPHVTVLPDEARPHADALVLGEAEESWPQLLADAARGRLRPLYRAGRPPSLTDLPPARHDLLRQGDDLLQTVFATRGCPHRCDFCNLRQIYDPAVRFRPVDQVVREIADFRARRFVFWDDHLFQNRDYALELMRAMAPLRRQWAAMVTVPSATDEELLDAAARAGCVCLFLGLETISSENLDTSGKSFNRTRGVRWRDVTARVHHHNIAVQAGIVFGFDGDDESVFGRTLDEEIDAGLDGATVSLLTPFPGTPLHARLHRDGRLLSTDWSLYNGRTAVTIQPARMSARALWEGYVRFRRQFYSPACILKRLARSRVRPAQSLFLNLGYRRALPKWPSPRNEAETHFTIASVQC